MRGGTSRANRIKRGIGQHKVKTLQTARTQERKIAQIPADKRASVGKPQTGGIAAGSKAKPLIRIEAQHTRRGLRKTGMQQQGKERGPATAAQLSNLMAGAASLTRRPSRQQQGIRPEPKGRRGLLQPPRKGGPGLGNERRENHD